MLKLRRFFTALFFNVLTRLHSAKSNKAWYGARSLDVRMSTMISFVCLGVFRSCTGTFESKQFLHVWTVLGSRAFTCDVTCSQLVSLSSHIQVLYDGHPVIYIIHIIIIYCDFFSEAVFALEESDAQPSLL